MSAYASFEVQRFGILGGVVTGIDLKQPLLQAAEDELRAALDTYGVLFFRDQHLDDAQQLALAKRFGPVSLYPIEKFFGSVKPGHQVIVDDADNAPGTDMWHTDVTWLESPPIMGFLSMLETPAYGGDTMWASTTAAYEALSPTMQGLLAGLSTVHSCHKSFVEIAERKSGVDGLAKKLRSYYPAVTHPLVVTHPRTGKRSLFVTDRGVMHRIEGMQREESDALLNFVDAHVAQPRFHLRWHWQPGELAIWDERTTLHRGVSDHYPQRRVVRRCTVDGEAPFFAA